MGVGGGGIRKSNHDEDHYCVGCLGPISHYTIIYNELY